VSQIPLPIIRTLEVESSSLSAQSAHVPQVLRRVRQGKALHATVLGNSGEVLGLNLTRGCVHRCAFCSVRAGPRYRGDETVSLYTNTAELLADELSRLPRKPKAVFVSPGTDPFPPVAEIQEETARVVRVLADHGVEAWLMTRGEISPAALQVLTRYRDHVKVTVALSTCEHQLQQVLEPETASPQRRLDQIAELRRLGVRVQVALDPLLPALTDTPNNLRSVLSSLSAVGITQVTAGYLFLRERITDNLRQVLAPHGWADLVLNAFNGGPVLTGPGLTPARYLPRVRRQHGYAMLMALASEYGIAVTISSLTNPDFAAPRPAREKGRPSLLALFIQAGQKRAAAN
jgi:DNA repair photolyase